MKEVSPPAGLPKLNDGGSGDVASASAVRGPYGVWVAASLRANAYLFLPVFGGFLSVHEFFDC